MDTPAPRRRFDFVAYLKLFRFPLVFTAIADSAAGCLMAGGPPRFPTMGLLALASSGLYFFGMSLNDIADRKRDQELAPGRMLPSGRLSLRAASIACASVLAVSLIAIVCIQETPLFPRVGVWAATVFFIVGYNVFLKIPPAMGLVRVGNLLLGLVAAVQWADIHPLHWKLVLFIALPEFIYVTALTYVSTLEDGVPHRGRLLFGSAFMVVGAGLASFILPLAYQLEGIDPWDPIHVINQVPFTWEATLFSGSLGIWIIRRALKAADKRGVMLLVRDGVGGLIFLDAALVASLHPTYNSNSSLVPFLVAALSFPAIMSVAIFKKLA